MHKQTKEDLDSWVGDIQTALVGKVSLDAPEEFTSVGVIHGYKFKVSFLLKTTPAKEVADVVHTTGQKLSDRNRYFFVLDKKRALLILQLYAY